MGKVPLLTREQEIEICRRIEQAEGEIQRTIYAMGFAAKEHIAMAEKLLAEPPKERFDRVIVDKLFDRQGASHGRLAAAGQESSGPRRAGRQAVLPAAGRKLGTRARRAWPGNSSVRTKSSRLLSSAFASSKR